jgi:hypothetical protein
MAAGIRRVRREMHSLADEERLASLLCDTPFDWRFVGSDEDSAASILARLAVESKQGVFFLAKAASLFLARAPGEFHVRKTRVALLDGPREHSLYSAGRGGN